MPVPRTPFSSPAPSISVRALTRMTYTILWTSLNPKQFQLSAPSGARLDRGRLKYEGRLSEVEDVVRGDISVLRGGVPVALLHLKKVGEKPWLHVVVTEKNAQLGRRLVEKMINGMPTTHSVLNVHRAVPQPPELYAQLNRKFTELRKELGI
ncbi:MAG: hypothetical protein V1817_02930 [Candidatus Micrarchaeota archaeon]